METSGGGSGRFYLSCIERHAFFLHQTRMIRRPRPVSSRTLLLLLFVGSSPSSASGCGAGCGSSSSSSRRTGSCPANESVAASWPWTSISNVVRGGPPTYTTPCASAGSSGARRCFAADNDITVSLDTLGNVRITSGGCPDHPTSTAAQAKTKTNYIEVTGSLTFPLVSSASAFTTPMRRGVVKALAAQCGANVDDVELSVANVTSSGGRRRVLLGVGGVVVT